ncbi:hypothetical protein CO174_02770 [Candidatus Uhrbacteria bacterium CG_4_9_14_3_um_filter_50_9]|uniref:M23ase beta-sheet core domain-containing protein n=1 Tax=Candidatus Uhrbacteria bacterium CG_4_9_14_3_um_filter_50_9 TaxID=1975035 RepID=A0A2M7XCB7_9BACT|nr:MAG: hypothetical protein CO174_02770 [Candidatus Uhrbacteria bacterium CG_4_9_14_3_um_filter_50_9]
MNRFLLILPLMLLGVGCAEQAVVTVPESLDDSDSIEVLDEAEETVVAATVSYPVEEYVTRRTFKQFGEYISDRFNGYHVADDVEFADVEEEVPVSAIADGTVLVADWVSGYGGVMLVEHDVAGERVVATYGHIDLASTELSAGDQVVRGQFLANLGDGESEETDGERKHLHFALYGGEGYKLAGYISTPSELDPWINPHSFFLEQGLDPTQTARFYNSDKDLGGDIYQVSFEIPDGWELEYIPSLEALNLFTLKGDGTARERSQVLIRYFDASSFLTLSTVEIFSTEDLFVGMEGYTARRYDIEKKEGVTDFADQPLWRNERHLVTDVRGEEGYTRYFVVAANPELDPSVYEDLLASMIIK